MAHFFATAAAGTEELLAAELRALGATGVKPGRGVVQAEFRLDPHHVQRLRQEAADGSKLLPEYTIEVRD